MRSARSLPRRARAALVVLSLLAAAGASTAGYSGQHRVALEGAPDQAAADVLHVARNQLGDDYVWGGDGPDGWDCSGLTSLWGSVGGVDDMPRVSRDQQEWAVPLPREQALPGDLVFFGHPVTHVGIYAGGGRMVDAAQSRGAVVERAVWTSGVVRFGRVPRRGMVRVKPWTPPELPPPTPASAGPADSPVAAPRSAPRPTRSAPPRTSGLAPLAGLPGKQAKPSSKTALKAVANARSVRGSSAWTDVSLVRTAWRHAGGGTLPATRDGIVAAGRRVPLKDARVGDLVLFEDPAHLGLYVGHGYMVDASRTRGAVVVRRVYASGFVSLVRLG